MYKSGIWRSKKKPGLAKFQAFLISKNRIVSFFDKLCRISSQ
jgi:hypothetical protein